MAEEESQNSQEGEVSKEGKPWLILSLMLLVVPVVTLAITQFVIIPKLQASLSVDGSSAKEKKEDEGGGKSSAKKNDKAELGGSGNSYAFEEVVANLAGTLGTRFIKISFEVQGSSGDVTERMRKNKPVVTDAIISVLSNQSIQSLEIPGGRNRMRLSLIQSINQAVGEDIVEELYFTEFIIQ